MARQKVGLPPSVLKAAQAGMLLVDSPREAKVIHQEWDHLRLRDKVVYLSGPSDSPKDNWQLLLPKKHRETVLKAFHDEHGHLVPEWTFYSHP